MKDRGIYPSSLAVTIFQWYLSSFESKSIDFVSYGLMAVLNFRAVADTIGATAMLATTVATSVVMADVRASTRAYSAADGTTALPLVFSSSSAFTRLPHAILTWMVELSLKASAL